MTDAAGSYSEVEPTEVISDTPKPRGAWRFFAYSGIGIFVFFVPVTIAGDNTILLDHVVNGLRALLGPATPYVILAIILFGTIYPFATGRWRISTTKSVFAVLNIVGLVAASMMVFDFGPRFLHDESLGPFLFQRLVIPVGLIVPIGAIFLALLVGYGLMEYIGVLVRPVMRPVWRTPGRSAVDAVASFVGSYAVGLLITNRQYRTGGYTAREAAIIATGFSTVSVTFMVIVARTLDIMHLWLWYFFLALVVTFVVTAVTARLPPLSIIPDTTFPGVEPNPEPQITGSKWKAAWADAMRQLALAPKLPINLWQNFRDGVLMVSQILPSIMSVGLIALVIEKHTPLFEWLGYIFYPIVWLLRLPDPELASTAFAVGIAEMFLPATLAAGATSELLRLVIAVTCVSQIIFFSAIVPALMATDIPMKVWHLVVIWVERVMLSILFAVPLAHLILMVA
ncbi:nucleoside recognition GATE domain-containing membrane protein YjiH [Tessaracoccus bendigoensis DSM 12906]|uniref:Nucleoside recognition GATE domain-containing membrane protein YjiH n=1 Tax=Tessaracoccus bendigoensis DSM 12906 TaxID=1123357 RepID=A0A1M6FKS7_9ACTN|nr:YjiH family protein [Tessaracoccus bendigoensis]SHI98253.1 nucleoside recognition GATE domain-containing membrane protein YjiH [Tessaracoccus bendigoensis DSM 12906]